MDTTTWTTRVAIVVACAGVACLGATAPETSLALLQMEGDWPYGVFLSHYYSIARQVDLTTQLYERLFEWMAGQGVTEWTTFRAVLE